MKVRLTESQMERLKSQLNEADSNRYNREVVVKVHAYGATYKGREIDWVTGGNIRLTYNIEMDIRSWGVKDISLYGIQGPSEIEVDVDYWVSDEENFDSVTETVTLPINWEAVVTEEEKNGLVTVGDEIEIDLANDDKGNLIVKSVTVTVYSL